KPGSTEHHLTLVVVQLPSASPLVLLPVVHDLAHNLDVLLRHRLLRQPGGFEGRADLVRPHVASAAGSAGCGPSREVCVVAGRPPRHTRGRSVACGCAPPGDPGPRTTPLTERTRYTCPHTSLIESGGSWQTMHGIGMPGGPDPIPALQRITRRGTGRGGSRFVR